MSEVDPYSAVSLGGAAVFVLALVVLFICSQFGPEQRRHRMAKRLGVSETDLLPWHYSNPWLDRCFTLVAGTVFVGAGLVGTFGGYLSFSLSGIEATSGHWRLAQAAGAVVFLVVYLWRELPKIRREERIAGAHLRDALGLGEHAAAPNAAGAQAARHRD